MAPPTTVIDNFNRANDTVPAGTAGASVPDAYGWFSSDNVTTRPSIVSNQLVSTSSGWSQAVRDTVRSLPIYAAIDLVSVGAAQYYEEIALVIGIQKMNTGAHEYDQDYTGYVFRYAPLEDPDLGNAHYIIGYGGNIGDGKNVANWVEGSMAQGAGRLALTVQVHPTDATKIRITGWFNGVEVAHLDDTIANISIAIPTGGAEGLTGYNGGFNGIRIFSTEYVLDNWGDGSLVLTSSRDQPVRVTGAALTVNSTWLPRIIGKASSNIPYSVRLTSKATSLQVYNPLLTGTATSAITPVNVRLSGQALTNITYSPRITGAAILTNTSYSVRVTGVISASPPVTFEARLTGQSSLNTSYSPRVTGKASLTRAYDVRLSAQAVSAQTFSPRIISQNSSTTAVEARVTGQASFAKLTDPRLIAKATTSLAQQVELVGRLGSSQAYDARVTAQATNNTTYTPRVSGKATSSLDSIPRLIAKTTSLTTYLPRITGQNSSLSNYLPRFTGKASLGQSYSAVLTGQSSSFTNFLPRIVAKATSSVTVQPEVRGQATNLVTYDPRLTGKSSSNVAYAPRVSGRGLSNLTISPTVVGYTTIQSLSTNPRVTGLGITLARTQNVRLISEGHASTDRSVCLVGYKPILSVVWYPGGGVPPPPRYTGTVTVT